MSIGLHIGGSYSELSSRCIDCALIRDINLNNFMMQGKDMFPRKYHYIKDMSLPDLSGPAPYFTRTQRPPHYFLIDFGISRRYEPGIDAPLEPVILGGDKFVPEFKDPESSQNPFPTDVFCAGNMIRQHFIEARYSFFSMFNAWITYFLNRGIQYSLIYEGAKDSSS